MTGGASRLASRTCFKIQAHRLSPREPVERNARPNSSAARYQAAKSDRLSSSLPVGIVFASFPTNTGGGGLRGAVIAEFGKPGATFSMKKQFETQKAPAEDLPGRGCLKTANCPGGSAVRLQSGKS